MVPGPKEQQIPNSENLFKIVLFVSLLLVSFYLTDAGMRAAATAALPAWVGFSLKWIAAIWDSILLLSLGILGHEAVHKVLFRSPFWNDFAGGTVMALGMVPFYAHRQFHLTHHVYTHERERDPESPMHDRPFWTGFIGSFIGLKIHYQIFHNNLLRIADRRYTHRVVKDTLFMASGGMLYFWLVPSFGIALDTTISPMAIVFPFVNWWRAVSDHYGIPPIKSNVSSPEEILDIADVVSHYDRSKGRREVTGWVILTHPWLEWLWSHVNYHEVHHKHPWLSHRYLSQAFTETRYSQPYLVTKGYWHSLFYLSKLHYYGTRDTMRQFLTLKTIWEPAK